MSIALAINVPIKREGSALRRIAEQPGTLSLGSQHSKEAAFAGREIIEHIIAAIHDHWPAAADFARLSAMDKAAMWGTQFLNPGIFHDW